jgi:predicted nuclease with TOPRIM domain
MFTSLKEFARVLKEASEEMDTLLEKVENQETDIKALNETIDKMRDKITPLEQKVQELEQAEPDLDEVSIEDLLIAVRKHYKADSSMYNDMKIETFFANINRFQPHDLEAWLKTLPK